jgi:type I restriction enzyme S subunit
MILPSEVLLSNFGQLLSNYYETIKNLYTQNQRLKEARDILLPRLMTGMIDVEKMMVPKTS